MRRSAPLDAALARRRQVIERIVELSVRHRFLVLLCTGALLLFGLWGLRNIRLDAIPDLSDVQVIVYTEVPGQAPQVVEDQVTYPLTTAMLSVPHSKVVRGFSFFVCSHRFFLFLVMFTAIVSNKRTRGIVSWKVQRVIRI
jgi:Cu/Ag efflux pump CusA